ncbi:MAG: chlorite dismutase family protein [Candidatus Dormibacteria bacterium]
MSETATTTRTVVGPVLVRDATKPSPRQLVRFAFYKVEPEWRRLAAEIRSAHRRELGAVLEEHSRRILLRTFTLVGTRGDSDMMVWAVSEQAERLQDLFADLNRTQLAGYLQCSHSYTAMTKRSVYVDTEHPNLGGTTDRLVLAPGKSRYLFVYPFVKTRSWWALSAEERQRMMQEHIRVGHEYPSVKINTTYSFGLDDQEFVVAFETDSAADFLDCVQALRDTEASSYTLRDVPSFTCVRAGIDEMLEALG